MRFFRKKYTKVPEVVYELRVGGHYLIEYSQQAVSRKTINLISKAMHDKGINIIFVPNPTNYVAFTPVPSTPNNKGKK